jgi:hypothetical protein
MWPRNWKVVTILKLASVWIIFLDKNSIDVLLQIENLLPSDFYPFDSTVNAFLSKLVEKYCQKQIEAISLYGDEMVNFQLNNAAEMEDYQVKRIMKR